MSDISTRFRRGVISTSSLMLGCIIALNAQAGITGTGGNSITGTGAESITGTGAESITGTGGESITGTGAESITGTGGCASR